MTTKTLDAATEATLVRILRNSRIEDEAGETWVDFNRANSDRHDFADIARWELRGMLAAAYRAGRESR